MLFLFSRCGGELDLIGSEPRWRFVGKVSCIHLVTGGFSLAKTIEDEI